MVISNSEFKSILDNFSKEVKLGNYQKMPYDTWRKLIKAEGPIEIVLEEFTNSVNYDTTKWYTIRWYTDGLNNCFINFNPDINDFGIFLENYCKKYSVSVNSILPLDTSKIDTINFGPTSISSSDLLATTTVSQEEFNASINSLKDKIQTIMDNNERKENKKMKDFNFDFGPMNANVVRMSIYGLAVKNKTGSWVSYDAKNEEIMDVDVFNFDGSKFMYKMPVAINDVAAGDIIIHMNIPMFVVGKSEDGKAVYAVDPVAGERKEIMLTKSPFMFNFVTKVVNFLGNSFNADASHPFGNLGLMMMLSEDNKSMSDMLPLMLVANGGNVNANDFDFSNPMVMYMMCKYGADDPIMMLALSGAFNKSASHVCNCGQSNQ